MNMVSVSKIIILMVLGFIFLTYLLLIKKKNPIISILLVGIISSVLLNADTVSNISEGFGGTIGNVGILILFSDILYEILKSSGATYSIGEGILKLFKSNREEIGLALLGGLFSVGLEKETSYLLLSHPLDSMEKIRGKSKKTLGLSLAIGLFITASIIPPTAGPYGVGKLVGADIFDMMKYGFIISIPMILAAVVYIRKFTDFKVDDVNKIDNKTKSDFKDRPNFIISIIPILLPVILIILKIVFIEYDYIGNIVNIVKSLGDPMVAMAISVILARLILGKYMDKDYDYITGAIKKSAYLILLMGASGALAMVFRATNISEYIGSLFIEYGLPEFILPFIIATFIRFIQGNELVAMMTTGAIISEIGLGSSVNPVIIALSICVGSLFFSYINDGFFFLVTENLEIYDMKDKIKTWSVLTTLVWLVGFISLIILNLFI